MEAKINNYVFEVETMTERIMVYRVGSVEPIAFIAYKGKITEKEFHIEIMDWVTKISD